MDLIILVIIAVFLIFRLFSMIGQDLGGNTDAFSEMSSKSKQLNKKDEKNKKQDEEADSNPMEKQQVESPVISKIIKAYPDFNAENFANGATQCFKNTIENFASGNKEALKELLTPSTYKVFAKVVDDRIKNNQSATDKVVGFISVKIVGANVTARNIEIEVEFVTDQINVVYDSQNRVINGHPQDVVRITDNWVFSRAKNSEELQWYVKETS
jgi:predicted lipid-binding transport protein (Tim44 family)